MYIIWIISCALKNAFVIHDIKTYCFLVIKFATIWIIKSFPHWNMEVCNAKLYYCDKNHVTSPCNINWKCLWQHIYLPLLVNLFKNRFHDYSSESYPFNRENLFVLIREIEIYSYLLFRSLILKVYANINIRILSIINNWKSCSYDLHLLYLHFDWYIWSVI